MKDSYGTYDGRRPEPSYPTDMNRLDRERSEDQAEIDKLRAERDELKVLLQRVWYTYKAVFWFNGVLTQLGEDIRDAIEEE